MLFTHVILYLEYITNKPHCYNPKTLGWVKWEKSCIGLIQENLIENSIQKYLPYILNFDGSCYYFPSLP